jgi:hypothetical protein
MSRPAMLVLAGLLAACVPLDLATAGKTPETTTGTARGD